MTPEDVAAAVLVEADTLDLVSNGVELFSLHLEQVHWPHFASEEDDQRQLLQDLVSLAALHLFGGSKFRTERRRWRSEQVGLEIAWQGRTYFVTTKGVRPIQITYPGDGKCR